MDRLAAYNYAKQRIGWDGDPKTLKKAISKARMKAHPDTGGSTELFNQIEDCCQFLKENPQPPVRKREVRVILPDYYDISYQNPKWTYNPMAEEIRKPVEWSISIPDGLTRVGLVLAMIFLLGFGAYNCAHEQRSVQKSTVQRLYR